MMQVPRRDILMVMDCDHLVEPEFFAKACSVMLDPQVAVCLVPQSFHNEVHPDCFDNTNYNFMFRLMPYYFGAGCCFVTGADILIFDTPES
jgi:cellulose synthase/poly-beta-1,6-N-acetylglucosamine synthase-like glycosyltransferase